MKEVKLLVCVLGIYAFYSVYAIEQEKISSTAYGEAGEKFGSTLFLLLVQCLVNAAFAAIALGLSSTGKRQAPQTAQAPFVSYSVPALAYILAMLFSNMALLYIDYPTQVLAKSCKPIPVMLMGVLILRKRQPLSKYVYVTLITAGIALFMLEKAWARSGHGSMDSGSSSYEKWGQLLLLLSLLMDGVSGPCQDWLVRQYRPSSVQLMLYNNIWACIFLCTGMMMTEGLAGFHFCMRYPPVMVSIAAFSLASACGQHFIYYTIQQYDSLVCTIATTTRKFWTIILSVLWFGHSLSTQQWLGVLLVFTGLSLEIYSSTMRQRQPGAHGKHAPAHHHKPS